MTNNSSFEVIVIGGSYSGLSAAMALGRASRKVLVIDSAEPCNRQTPHSHNFLTQDGNAPNEISSLARTQVARYESVGFFDGRAVSGRKNEQGFEIITDTNQIFEAKELIFATGIKDEMPDLPGFSECWGISVLHCPYCHGYEVRDEKTGILANGDTAFEMAILISNWTKDLSIYTNGASTLTEEQRARIGRHPIRIVESELAQIEHTNGNLKSLLFRNGSKQNIRVLYTRRPFVQHCLIPEMLGCELTDDGFIKVDMIQETSIKGVFACGDNAGKMRTVANAVSTGTTAGIAASRLLIFEDF